MISIVSAYYNRKKQFIKTLNSIAKSKVKEIEYIVVDDASDDDQRIEDLAEDYRFLKVIRVEPTEKWYLNSCIPFNLAIGKSSGDIIVLQNPECLHVQDVLSYLQREVGDHNYISVSAYATNEETTKRLHEISDFDFLSFLNNLNQERCTHKNNNGWYNHSVYAPTYFHFCAGISRSNIGKLGGFDERYAMGISFDDTDFIDRVRNLGLDMKVADEVSVIHQYHPPFYYQRTDFKEAHSRNKLIYLSTHHPGHPEIKRLSGE